VIAGRRVLSCVAAASLLLSLAASGRAWATDGGRIEPIDGAVHRGDLAGTQINAPIVAIAATPDGGGYWLVSGDGGVFTFGNAGFFGSMGAVALNEPVVGMASSPTGLGYWLVARDGGVFAFGDAGFFGSAGAIDLNRPITSMASSPTGLGYWLAGDDGGVFAYGDAVYWGSTGGMVLNRPVVAMAATPTGLGYWLVADDGGVFTFGDARYHGSGPADGLVGEFIALLPSSSGLGYSLAESTGRVTAYGDATVAEVAVCDTGPAVVATASGAGALLLRHDIRVPAGPATSGSSGADSDHIEVGLKHGQACQTAVALTPGAFIPPVVNPVVTSPYGLRRHPIWGVTQLHSGIDLVRTSGTAGAPVLASAAGTVVEVESRVAYGTNVVIDHGDRVATVYAHLGSVAVAVGDPVAQGQTIGTIGSTGFSTGAHLHYEVRVDGAPIDPTPYAGSHTYARVVTIN